jgi:hypothetical protein
VVVAYGVHLVRTEERHASVSALASAFGGAVGLPGVLADQDRSGYVVRVPGRAARWGFRWDQDDSYSTLWWPQGISTSADADPSGVVAGRRMLCTSWYAKTSDGVNQGSRVTFVDLDTLAYRHVLLVTASVRDNGTVRLTPLNVHAGGVVWRGEHLHVAATARGLYSCRLSDIVAVPPGLPGALGHRYVLPVRFGYTSVMAVGVEPLRYSFVSLDVAAARLVAGEYGRFGRTTRLLTFPAEPATGSPEVSADGVALPDAVHDTGVAGMQGVAVVAGRWFVTTSAGPYLRGSLHVGRPGRLRRHRWVLPAGIEDLSTWPSENELWSLSEWPGRRFVFSMRAGDWR